ncbi:YHS domain-containing protein [Aeoliella sp.]|uniref:YHS domain-containing protein n=1 Tax=Aeoliella sp. TaxID=2795800 RepID=UPI003CCBDAA0
MSGTQESSTFGQQIQQRLDVAQATFEHQRDTMNHVMVELEQREAMFKESAESIMSSVLRPTLEELSTRFSNAQLVDLGSPYFTKCELSRSVQFPATAHVAFVVTHDDSIEHLTVQYEAHLLPVFIQYERSDMLDRQIQNVDDDVVRQWAEKKLLGFLDSYLKIETHEQYQHYNIAIDPVCGMKVVKPRGLAHEHLGETYYFCAQRCLDRFVQSPGDYLRSTDV